MGGCAQVCRRRSDADWVTNIREEVNMDHFRFIFADIGATGAFGTPENDTLQKIPLSISERSVE